MTPHSKRYMLILEVWNHPYRANVTEQMTTDEYDTLEEVQQDIEIIHGWYMNPRCNSTSISGFYWGYVVLDFEEEKILKVCHDGLRKFSYISSHDMEDSEPYLRLMDKAFRKDDEIPKDYVWRNENEYRGWLQFRWGDGKNAVSYNTRADGNKVKMPNLPLLDDFMFGYCNSAKKKKKVKKNLPSVVKDDDAMDV